MTKIETETFVLTYEELTKCIVDYLRSQGGVLEDETVISMDFPVPLGETGEIFFDLELMYDE